MKLLLTLLLASSLFLYGCIDTESTTTINKDGSGTLVSTIDIGKMIGMMMSGKDLSEEKNEVKDTIVHFRSMVDTSTKLNARQKELMRDMFVRINMDMKASMFKLSINAPFRKIEDLNEISKLMAEKEFDDLFDKSTKDAGMGSGDKGESSGKNDNLFGSVFPDFYDCQYAKGKIACKLNKAKYEQRMAEMKEKDMDINDEVAEQMFGEATFTNRIILPGKAKSLTSSSLTKKSDTEYVQTGSLLELFKSPAKYEYSLEY